MFTYYDMKSFAIAILFLSFSISVPGQQPARGLSPEDTMQPKIFPNDSLPTGKDKLPASKVPVQSLPTTNPNELNKTKPADPNYNRPAQRVDSIPPPASTDTLKR
jgi:hypothetical protein